VKDDLGGGNVGLGILVGATGVGLVIGSFFAASVLQTLGMRALYAGSLLVMGVGFGVAAASPTVAVAAVLAAFATVGNGAAIVCNQLLVQEGAPDAMRGRALAVLMSTYYGILGIAMAGAGLLVDGAGARAAWAAAGAVYLVSTVLAFALTRSAREDRLGAAEHAQPEGLERIEALMAEIDETRRREQEKGHADVAFVPPESRSEARP
jgi:MFS family permease